jgi:uncharacterized protein YigA (DUF484 family)
MNPLENLKEIIKNVEGRSSELLKNAKHNEGLVYRLAKSWGGKTFD